MLSNDLVNVIGVPGYEDFQGVLLMEFNGLGMSPKALVAYEWEGEDEMDIFDKKYLSLVEGPLEV